MSAHSHAEAYSTLTRRGERALFGFSAGEAWAALASLRAITSLVGLTAAQTFETAGLYADSGGIGPRFYDALIEGAAVMHRILGIVTCAWATCAAYSRNSTCSRQRRLRWGIQRKNEADPSGDECELADRKRLTIR